MADHPTHRFVEFIYSPGNVSDCPNGFHWIWTAFHECAVDGRDVASVCLGLVSILCFILSSIPQYYQSWKTGNMDKALSIWFLLGWLSGDSCNLIGAFLANQLPLQVRILQRAGPRSRVLLWIYLFDFRRRSTEGLALSLFCLVILGNLTYGLSILLKNPENGQSEGDYVLHHLPWIGPKSCCPVGYQGVTNRIHNMSKYKRHSILQLRVLSTPQGSKLTILITFLAGLPQQLWTQRYTYQMVRHKYEYNYMEYIYIYTQALRHIYTGRP
uniref:Solute carrier family 66 member 1 n=1 Tax=Leptobrachium leishanense TaxID=445787 RepID=A0A8C5WE75_9ANUR